MVLAEDHLPLRPVQAMPGAHPPFERAAQPVPIAVRMATLHLLEQGDRPQTGPALQQRQDVALPNPVQRIRDLTAPLPAGVLLRRQAWIALDPTPGPLADPRLGGGDKLRVLTAKPHVNSHLLVRDVSSGHERVLVANRDPNPARTRRDQQAGAMSPRRRSGQALRSGYTRPSARPDRPSARVGNRPSSLSLHKCGPSATRPAR